MQRANLAAYWKRKYRQHKEKEPWYLLTNLSNLAKALTAYKKRAGIEAMFKDCKTGGYNLEGSHASIERLTRLVLLIALAYTWATLKLDFRLIGKERGASAWHRVPSSGR